MRYELEKTINNAISKGYFHQVRLLVALGYNVNQSNKKGQTPLMLCSLIQKDSWAAGIAKTLLETHLVVVGKTDYRGLTALHYACIYDRTRLIRVLLDYSGFNTQALDLLRNRPMHYAAVTGNLKIVEMLLGYEMKFGVKPSMWMTANIAGMTPIALAKRFQRSDCFVIMRDLVGDIKFPARRDLKESRVLSDWNYAEQVKEKEKILGPKKNEENPIDRNMPTYKLRLKVKEASNRYAKSSGELERSHLENEIMSILPKYNMHYSFDFKSVNYINEPRYQENVIYVRPKLSNADLIIVKESKIVNDAKLTEESKYGQESAKQRNIYQNKSVSTLKNVPQSTNENINLSNSKDRKKENNERSEESESKSSVTDSPPDYSKVCKHYEKLQIVCQIEEPELKDKEENSEKEEKSSEESVKSTKVDFEKKDEEEEEEEICEASAPLLDEFGGFYTTETCYRHLTMPKPFLQNYRSLCIKDRNKLRCLCKPPPGTITNVEEKFGRKIVGKYLAAVLLDVILPGYEKGPPFSKKCIKLISWVYDNGLLNQELMNETLIPGHNFAESMLCDIYAKEYEKVTFHESCDFPLCRTNMKSMFNRYVIERKKKIAKPCCLTCRTSFLVQSRDMDESCKDFTGDNVLGQLRYHYGYQKSHSFVKSFGKSNPSKVTMDTKTP